MLRWQEPDSGLFYQLPALPDVKGNYLETSGSLMVAYSLLKGARLGVLAEPKYRAAGEKILVGIELRQFTVHDGKVELHGICKGAGLGPAGNLRRNGTVEYYLSEDVVHDEPEGRRRLHDGLRRVSAGQTGRCADRRLPQSGDFQQGVRPHHARRPGVYRL